MYADCIIVYLLLVLEHICCYNWSILLMPMGVLVTCVFLITLQCWCCFRVYLVKVNCNRTEQYWQYKMVLNWMPLFFKQRQQLKKCLKRHWMLGAIWYDVINIGGVLNLPSPLIIKSHQLPCHRYYYDDQNNFESYTFISYLSKI
jgi:hypothetical protein